MASTAESLLIPSKRGSGKARNRAQAFVAAALVKQGVSRVKIAKSLGMGRNTLKKIEREELISDDTAQYLESTFKNRQILGKNVLLSALTDPESIDKAPLSHVALAYKALCASEEKQHSPQVYVNILQAYEKPSKALASTTIDVTPDTPQPRMNTGDNESNVA